MSDLRYLAKLVLDPADFEARWRGGLNDADALCRKVLQRRRLGEIALLVDHHTGETFRVELAAGDIIERTPL